MHLTWRVILPGHIPINITYDNTSDNNSVDNLNSVIITSLTEYISNEYIESTLILTLQANVSTNQTKLDCLIKGLGNESAVVFVNSSGTLIIIMHAVFHYLIII